MYSRALHRPLVVLLALTWAATASANRDKSAASGKATSSILYWSGPTSRAAFRRLTRIGSAAPFSRLVSHMLQQPLGNQCGPTCLAIVLNAVSSKDQRPADRTPMLHLVVSGHPESRMFLRAFTPHSILGTQSFERHKGRDSFNGKPDESGVARYGLTLEQLHFISSDLGLVSDMKVDLRRPGPDHATPSTVIGASIRAARVGLAELTRGRTGAALRMARAILAEGTSGYAISEMVRALEDEKSYVVGNFLRPKLGQQGSGHFSLVAGYDAIKNSFLVLDVSPNYPAFWVPAKMFFESMDTVDTAEQARRGYLIWRRAAHWPWPASASPPPITPP